MGPTVYIYIYNSIAPLYILLNALLGAVRYTMSPKCQLPQIPRSLVRYYISYIGLFNIKPSPPPTVCVCVYRLRMCSALTNAWNRKKKVFLYSSARALVIVNTRQATIICCSVYIAEETLDPFAITAKSFSISLPVTL